MEDVAQLKEQHSHLLLSANDIIQAAKKEGRILTDEEITRSDGLVKEADGIAARIEKIDAALKHQAIIEDRVNELGKPGKRQIQPSQPISEPRASSEDRITPVHRFGSLKAFNGKDGDVHAYEAGMWIVDRLFPAHHPLKSHARNRCHELGIDFKIRASLAEGVPSTGGNLVPAEMGQRIIDLREQYGIFRQWCDIEPMSSDTKTVPRRSGSVTPYWVAEGAALTASDPSWDNVQLTAKKLTAFTKFSTEVSEDALVNLADWLTFDIAQQFAYEEDRVGFNGTGISTDGNIVGITQKVQQAASLGSFPAVVTATHNTFAELDATDIMTLMAAVPQYALTDAAFFTSQSGASLCFGRLMAAAGGNTQQSLSQENISALRAKGIVGYYQGYPIVASQVLPTEATTKTNLPMLCFGSLRRACLLGERRGITFATDSSVYFASDQIAVRATARLDINCHATGTATVSGPLAVLKGGSS